MLVHGLKGSTWTVFRHQSGWSGKMKLNGTETQKYTVQNSSLWSIIIKMIFDGSSLKWTVFSRIARVNWPKRVILDGRKKNKSKRSTKVDGPEHWNFGSAQQIDFVKSRFRQSRRPRKFGHSIFDRSERPYRTVKFYQEERPLWAIHFRRSSTFGLLVLLPMNSSWPFTLVLVQKSGPEIRLL